MEGNRFRMPTRLPQRAATSLQSGRACDVQQNRRSFTERQPNQHQVPTQAAQRPSSRFNTNRSVLIDDDVPSQVPPRASMHSSGSSNSFSSPLDDGRGERVRKSPASKPDATTKHGVAEKLDDFHSAEYGSNEVGDFSGPSVSQIEEAIEHLTGALTGSFRCVETLEEGWENAQGTMQRQHLALLREREMIAKLTFDLEAVRGSLEQVKRAEKDANARLVMSEEAVRVSSAECERIQGNIKKIEDGFADERGTYAEAQRKLEVGIRSMASKIDCQTGLIVEKDQKIHGMKQELSYVQRRIEDEINSRKKLSAERDELCCQVVELQESLKSEGKKAASVEEKSTVVIGQLRLKNEEQTEKNIQLKSSLNETSKSNLMLGMDMELVGQTVHVMEGFMLQFSEAVDLCREWQPLSNIQSLDLVLGEDRRTSFLTEGAGKSDGIISNESQPSSNVSQSLRLFAQGLRDVLLEAAVRETILTSCFARTKTTLQGLLKARLDSREAANRARTTVQNVKEEISTARKELDELKDTLARADDESIKWRRHYSQSITRLRSEKEVVDKEFDTYRHSLEQLKAEILELQKVLSGQDSTIKQLQDTIAVVEEEKAKALGELGGYRKMAEDIRCELHTLTESSESALKDVHVILRTEALNKDKALKDLTACEVALGDAKNELQRVTKLAHEEREAAKMEFARVMKEKADVSADMAALKERLNVCATERETAVTRLTECMAEVRIKDERLKDLVLETERRQQALKVTGPLRTADAKATKISDEGMGTKDLPKDDDEHTADTENVLGSISLSQALDSTKCAATTSALPRKRQQGKAPLKAAKPKRSKARTPRIASLRHPNGNESRSSFGEGEDDEDWFVNF